jgi:hypothetical protein
MTDMEKGSSLHGWHKRMESLVALAMSRAIGAFKLASTPAPPFVANAVSIVNSGGVIAAGWGPGSAANQMTFASAPFTALPGTKLFISGSMSLVNSFAPGNNILFQLIRDAGGVETILPPTQDAGASAGNKYANGSLVWVDTAPPAGPHTYAIRITNVGGGATGAVPINDASVTLMMVT